MKNFDELLKKYADFIVRVGVNPQPGQVLIIRENGSTTPPSGTITYTVQRNDNLILYTDVVTPAQMGAMMDAMPHRVIYNAVGRPYISLHVLRGEDPLTILRDAVALLPGA